MQNKNTFEMLLYRGCINHKRMRSKLLFIRNHENLVSKSDLKNSKLQKYLVSMKLPSESTSKYCDNSIRRRSCMMRSLSLCLNEENVSAEKVKKILLKFRLVKLFIDFREFPFEKLNKRKELSSFLLNTLGLFRKLKTLCLIWPRALPENFELYKELDLKNEIFKKIVELRHLEDLMSSQLFLSERELSVISKRKQFKNLHLGLRNWLTYQMPLIRFQKLIENQPLRQVSLILVNKSVTYSELGQIFNSLSFLKSIQSIRFKAFVEGKPEDSYDFESLVKRLKNLKFLRLKLRGYDLSIPISLKPLKPLFNVEDFGIKILDSERLESIEDLRYNFSSENKKLKKLKLHLCTKDIDKSNFQNVVKKLNSLREKLMILENLEGLSLKMSAESYYENTTCKSNLCDLLDALHNLRSLKIRDWYFPFLSADKLAEVLEKKQNLSNVVVEFNHISNSLKRSLIDLEKKYEGNKYEIRSLSFLHSRNYNAGLF